MHSRSTRGSLGSVALFFAAAFAITWTLQLPAVLAQRGALGMAPEPLMPLVVLGVFGPTLAAVLVRAREAGRAGVRELFRPLRAWRADPRWYLVALAHPGVLLALGMAAWLALGGQGALVYPPDPPARIVAAILIAVGEEVGWRGFALPRLTKLVGPLRASLVIGPLWALWHVPMLMGSGVSLSLMPTMLVFFSAGSVVMTWIWLRSGGSLVLMVLAHLGAHVSNSHAPLPDESAPLLVHTTMYTLAAIAVVALDREAFTRREPLPAR